MKRFTYCALLALLLYGCVDPFEPELGVYSSTLVVDGLFSNSAYPSIIKLSRSFPYSENRGEPVGQATVIIEDNQGNQTELEEITTGVFQTDPSNFQGQIGRSYRLLISMADGSQFESTLEEMKPAPPIEDIYFVFGEDIPDNSSLEPIPGAQFYLNTSGIDNSTRYYRWGFEETYQYVLPHPPNIRAEFGSSPGNGNDEIVAIPWTEYEGYKCWKTERSTPLIIATTDHLTQDVVAGMPIHFVNNRTTRLSTRYSLLVKQYALSKDYYEYLRKIKEINQTTGSLFDPIPNEVFGNISSSDGKDIPVLGYFGVAGVSEARVFVNRADMPDDLRAPSSLSCLGDTIPIDFRQLYSRINYSNKVLYDYHTSPFGEILGFLLTSPTCASCAANEATNEIPDFW